MWEYSLFKEYILFVRIPSFNSAKMRIPFRWVYGAFLHSFKFCFATIGVCVFRASTTVGALFYFRRIVMIKERKIIIAVVSVVAVLLLILIISLASCKGGSDENDGKKNEKSNSQTVENENNPEIDDTEVEEPNEENEETIPTVIEEPKIKLSSQCDIVLAEGTDENGNVFELVANEIEDYTGTITKVGVIKNNQWLKPLSESHPFVNGSFLYFKSYSYGTDDGVSIKNINNLRDHVKFVGNGCFTIGRRILYNCNNDKSFDLRKLDEEERSVFVDDYHGTNSNNRKGYITFEVYDKHYHLGGLSYGAYLVYSLNTSTMESKRIMLEVKAGAGVYTEAYNDGLFFYNGGFYDINGNKTIDISHLGYHTGSLVFDNGQCTFTVSNDQETLYDITIDKTGKVINSVLTKK